MGLLDLQRLYIYIYKGLSKLLIKTATEKQRNNPILPENIKDFSHEGENDESEDYSEQRYVNIAEKYLG